MTNATETITVRSLRHLDALVGDRLFNLFGGRLIQDWLDRPLVWDNNLPRYTTWAGVDAVIQNREDAGWQVEMANPFAPGLSSSAKLCPHSQLWRKGDPFCQADTIPIAVCLAALASVGCRVRLELGED